MEEDDERREAAIASAASLQSNFKPKTGITSTQLSKFQELHKRRLQIKERSKTKKKTNGLVDGTSKSQKKGVRAEEFKADKSSARNEDSNASSSKVPMENISAVQQDNHPLFKKRQKLHWGLDTKERWEMKANM